MKLLLSCLAALLIVTIPARAALVTNFLEVGPDVVVTTDLGSINLSGLTFVFSGGFPNPFVVPANARLKTGPTTQVGVYSGASGPAAFGPGDSNGPDFTSGSALGMANGSTIYLPVGYITNTPVGPSSATWLGESFASLGLTPGTYVYTWGVGPDADSWTINVGAAIPEPSTYISIAGFIGLAAFIIRRQQGQSAKTA